MKRHDYTMPAKAAKELYEFSRECRLLDSGVSFTMVAVANRLDAIRNILSDYLNRDNEIEDNDD